MKSRSSEAFVSQGDAVEFVAALRAEVQVHPATRHPYLLRLAKGELPHPQEALRDFAFQYDGYAAAFPEYVAAAMEPLVSDAHRALMAQNLAEEIGDPDSADPRDWPHRALYRRFQSAIGVDGADRASRALCPASLSWREDFLALCSSGREGVGIGALGLGTESIVPLLYSYLLDAVRHLGCESRDATLFFEVHAECDEEHTAVMEALTCDLARDSESRRAIRWGTFEALRLRHAFWDVMLERAQQQGA